MRFETEASLKGCTRCKKWLSLGSFHKDSSRWDGLQATCKTCKLETKSLWGSTDAGQMSRRAEFERTKRLYPDKYLARYTSNNARARGKLVPSACVVCSATENIEGHHDDYAKPLDVRWLCRQCHNKHHRSMLGGE